VTSLVPSARGDDDSLDALRARLAGRERELHERHAAVAQAKTDLAAFRIRYRREVGLLHEELEEIERGIAEAELGEFAKRLEEEGAGTAKPPDGPETEPAARLTSDAVRRLFRDVAKTIHPDLARDAEARHRRHALMVEANRAYAMGDEERLRSILDAWERSPESVQGSDPAAERERVLRRLAQLDERLIGLAGELAELQETPLWKLKVMVDEAAARGKDLIADQVRRLRRDIMAARNRLDAMLWQP
jgi:hypothetical protein